MKTLSLFWPVIFAKLVPWAACGVAKALPEPPPSTLLWEDLIPLEAQSVPPGQAVELSLPPLPARPGRVLLLRFRAVILTATEGGCNYNASVSLNGLPLRRYTADRAERLVGREPSLELTAPGHLVFPVFSGDRLMVMFAPTVDRGDPMTTDGQGATFGLDISDVAQGVAGNTLAFRNHLRGKMDPGFGFLRIEEIAVGWLDRAQLPPPSSAVLPRGPVAEGVAVGALRLAQSQRGGFVVRSGAPLELLVETGLGLPPDAPSVLIADDRAPEPPDVQVRVEPWGLAGCRLIATWTNLRLTRTLALQDGLVRWQERWTNTGDTIRSVPFRHRLFLCHESARFWLGGSEDNTFLASSAANPTLFLESGEAPGRGFGLTAESDWLRLLMGLRCRAGVGEVFSDTLALAPQASIDFDLTLTPVADGGGYWSFLNRVRQRWGVNDIPLERPIFFGYAQASGEGSPEERMVRSLGHLGSIFVVLGPWQRLEPDARVVTAGRYPKLPPDAPRAPGTCLDLDVEKWLTFAHREPFWEQLKNEVTLIRRAAPQVKVMQMLHPAMEVVYRPLQDRWPMAAEAIRRADGSVFEEAYYSRAWLGDWADRDWGVLYYVPRPGSAYLEMLLTAMQRSLDELELDGLYCDEFSWAGSGRGYSRYDYSRWDGYSADLDDRGNVVRLKCDNGFITESAQLQMVNAVLQRGKFFLNNGGNALRSLNRLPHARFIEGGNGPAMMPQGHLSPTPLVLGNMGDEATRQGVFESVKACLSQGCLYSPTAVNLLLNGPDDFVCKLYPITVKELGPGWIIGQERLITTVSRSFPWPPTEATLRLYRYDAQGQLLEPVPERTVEAGQELALEVPPQGLLIAERR